jgi:hypothetical protein
VLSIDVGQQATWIFDEVPPSGTRRGGNPSEHAFEHDLDTFVREVLQNSNDVITSAPVEVDFEFLELQGEELDEYLSVFEWERIRTSSRCGRSYRRWRKPSAAIGMANRT